MKLDASISYLPQAGVASRFSQARNGDLTPDFALSGDDYPAQVLDTLERSGSVSGGRRRRGAEDGSGKARGRPSKRARQVVELVGRMGALRHDQIHRRLWDGEADAYSPQAC